MIQGVNKHAEIAAQTKISPADDSADELLQSANSASGSARNAWLAYLVLNVYLLVTIAGVTHVDLLLNSTVTLPIVNVKIPLFGFFSVAPILLLLVHLGILVQHAMLSHKYDHFSKAVSDWESYNNRVHPSRRYVDGYVFSQMTAGPKPPKLLGSLMRLMVFVTFSLLPVLVLLYFQIKFLPYHEVGVTHVHRIAVFLDLVLLLSVRPYIAISYLKPLGSKLEIGAKDWQWKLSYWSLSVSAVVCLSVFIFSLFVATVPHGCINAFEEQAENCFSLDKMAAKWAPREVAGREVFALTALLFEGEKDQDTGKTTSPLFSRNIVVSDTDLVPDKDDKFEEVSISLRDRDLRFAVFDRADMHRADLTNANLKRSSLIGTKLEKAILTGANLQGANLHQAKLQEANLSAAELQGAKFWRASLLRAQLTDANLQGANLHQAQLLEAVLFRANLQGANLFDASLNGAFLSQANLGGANLNLARPQGANFHGANLQGANLRQAKLQGAMLLNANLQWANLMDANLEGADLRVAKLQGANFHGANLQGANLFGTHIWHTKPPAEMNLKLVDLRGAKITPLTDVDRKDLQMLIAEGKNTVWGEQLKIYLEPLVASETKNWGVSEESRVWKLLMPKRPNSDDLSVFLADLVCDDPDGYIAEGITSNTLIRFHSNNDVRVEFVRKLSNENCFGAKTLDGIVKTRLCRSVFWSAEVDIKNTFCSH